MNLTLVTTLITHEIQKNIGIYIAQIFQINVFTNMPVAQTSKEHFRTFDAGSLYSLIRKTMFNGEYCIADLSQELGLEKSTVSTRLNELKNYGELEYTGKKPSHSTGIMSMHFRLKGNELEQGRLI